MNIISAKVQFQGFVQKTKKWSQIKIDLAKKKKEKEFLKIHIACQLTTKHENYT